MSAASGDDPAVLDDSIGASTSSPRPALVGRRLAGSGIFAELAIPEAERWADAAEEASARLIPFVVRGLFSTQARQWSPQTLAAHWPDLEVRVTVNLPAHSVPYREHVAPYQRVMALAEFVTLLANGASCYLAQTPLALFPELQSDMNLRSLRLGIVYATNIWVGSRTRSGLHYDNADNLFAQIHAANVHSSSARRTRVTCIRFRITRRRAKSISTRRISSAIRHAHGPSSGRAMWAPATCFSYREDGGTTSAPRTCRCRSIAGLETR